MIVNDGNAKGSILGNAAGSQAGARDTTETGLAYSVSDVSFRFPHAYAATPEWVVDTVSFTVAAGEIVGIVGPNGAGKTTILKVLGSLLVPEQGQVRLFDRDLWRIPAQEMARLVATVPQISEQTFPFTVAETVVMGRFPHRAGADRWFDVTWETDEDFAWADWAMHTMQVSHLADRLLSEVSGGERQRTLVARALAQASPVLLMDEPTTFLDFRHQLDICRVLERVRLERKLTVIFVSHDLNLASQCCDRLLLLNRGRLVACGTAEEILVPHLINDVYGCHLLIDRHPETGRPRVCLPAITI